VIVFIGVLVENDVRGSSPTRTPDRERAREFGYLAGFGLIYIEESGIPLFHPWRRLPCLCRPRPPVQLPDPVRRVARLHPRRHPCATNLYLISRRYGRRLLEHRLARFLHLTPARLEEAEHWFRRYGPWALIFGRHIPGFRVPLTVAAGILELPHRVFRDQRAGLERDMAGLFLTLGAVFGSRVVNSIRANTWIYAGVAVASSHHRGGRVHSIAPPAREN